MVSLTLPLHMTVVIHMYSIATSICTLHPQQSQLSHSQLLSHTNELHFPKINKSQTSKNTIPCSLQQFGQMLQPVRFMHVLQPSFIVIWGCRADFSQACVAFAHGVYVFDTLCQWLCISVYMYIYIHIYIYMCVCVCVCMFSIPCACCFASIHICVCECVWVWMCVRIFDAPRLLH
jgi:hypothetical protein